MSAAVALQSGRRLRDVDVSEVRRQLRRQGVFLNEDRPETGGPGIPPGNDASFDSYLPLSAGDPDDRDPQTAA